MDERSGIELSLLEGMDEKLLVRLHQAGIRRREELESRIAAPDARRELARELGISTRRLEILHHLNFLLPEERAERFLVLERQLAERDRTVNHEMRQMWRAILVFLAAGFVIALVAVWHPWKSGPPPAIEAQAERIAALERQVAALRPLGVAHAESLVLAAMASVGPAPGWSGPLPWSEREDAQVRALIDGDDRHLPVRAVSLALARLARVESTGDTLSPLGRARLAAAHVADFPAVPHPADVWDACAVLLRTRFRSRALGLVPLDPESPDLHAAAAWAWTSPGFLTAEEFLARLESLPVRAETLPLWSETLGRIREAADLGRTREGARPEAYARDYWVRRSELEYAVVAALLGRSDLQPFHASAPAAFLRQRLGFLDGAVEKAPPRGRPPLAWLAVEYVEAEALVDWLAANPGRVQPAPEAGWVTVLDAVAAARDDLPAVGRSGALEAQVARAAQLSGVAGDAWLAPRTRWETGLRPLLMATRARALGAGPSDRAAH